MSSAENSYKGKQVRVVSPGWLAFGPKTIDGHNGVCTVVHSVPEAWQRQSCSMRPGSQYVGRSVQQGWQHDTFCNEHRRLRFYHHHWELKNLWPRERIVYPRTPLAAAVRDKYKFSRRIQAVRRYRSV